MACRRANHNRNDIVGKNERGIVFPVENKVKLMFRVVMYNPLKCFEHEPANTFQFVL